MIRAYEYCKNTLYNVIDAKLRDVCTRLGYNKSIIDYDAIHEAVDDYMFNRLSDKRIVNESCLARNALNSRTSYDLVISTDEVFEETIYNDLPTEFVERFVETLNMFGVPANEIDKCISTYAL